MAHGELNANVTERGARRWAGIGRAFGFAAALTLLCLLVACSPGAPSGPPFVDENVWLGEIRSDAVIVSNQQFRQLYESGQLEIALVSDEQTQRDSRDADFLAARDALASVASPSESVTDLLAAAQDEAGHGGAIELELGFGAFTLLGIGERISAALHAEETAEDSDNALADYALSYGLLSDALRAQVPEPGSLSGSPLGEILAALNQLDLVLGTIEDLDNTRFEPQGLPPPGPSLISPAQQTTGDQAIDCVAPTGFVANYWYPLRNFVSPMKDQARRGTCWAFTAIGAVESRELVQNYNHVNLSEQFLNHAVKRVWEPSHYDEGSSSDSALAAAVAEGWGIPPESAWEYNRSAKRASTKDGKAEYFVGTCDDYGLTCSESAHQAEFYCTVMAVRGRQSFYCGYSVSTYTGPATPASTATQIWANGQTFQLNRYRQYLAQGHVIMAAFPVYRGFSSAVGGVVTDYTRECSDEKGGSTKKCGGHLVQIVGFLSNDVLWSGVGPQPTYGGGGLFVVKNSWGCFAGDGGYYYVPAAYVEQIFGSLSVLHFDSRRSAAWINEQQSPGSHEAPIITVSDVPKEADLRAPVEMADFFTVTHSATSSVTLHVHSSVAGTVYDGPFVIKFPIFGSPSLFLTFEDEGVHDLTVTARHQAGPAASVSFTLQVINSPPEMELSFGGSAYQGSPYFISALVSDVNEPDTIGLCSRMSWSVTGGGSVTGAGCHVQVVFATQGSQFVTASTTDREGRSVTRSSNFFVLPPSENPYPLVASHGVFGYDEVVAGPGVVFCDHLQVDPGATIDLRRDSCTWPVQPDPVPRYSARLTVLNPSQEALTYDWEVFATGPFGEFRFLHFPGSASPIANLVSPGNTSPETYPCRVTVAVNAPDPSRSKFFTVWSGNCTFDSVRVN